MFATTAMTKVARAETAPVSYAAPPECPDVDAFRAEIEKRADAGRVLARAHTSIAKSAEHGYDGTLRIDDRARDVHAATCEEVVQALALAAALAAEEMAAEAPMPPEPAISPVAPVKEVPAPPSAAVDRPRPVTREPENDDGIVLGAGLGATGAVGPTVAPEVFVFGGFELDGRSLRLALDVARSSDMDTVAGTARFERWSARVDGCPLSVRFGVRLSPCVGFEGGLLRGMGQSISNAEASSLVWLSLGVGGRADLDLTRSLFVAADVQLGFPLLRHGFFVRPSDVVYEVPAVFGQAALSLGYRFSE
ncbi:hypothetical protein AKJ09_09025 [Labilithrix luteola]|uniref:Uncharacterized protein n=1 Tax=Labilithrix luteola TaxID=1391654 RepID=A0A0K1Q9M5_9BACT|nr:hypothetical protein [Labilithrix luteola]AKV02362.1 hypothetical protein AKJ09_09025 [Labilithrix luteola]